MNKSLLLASLIAAAALVSALTFTATADAKRHHTTTTQMTAQGGMQQVRGGVGAAQPAADHPRGAPGADELPAAVKPHLAGGITGQVAPIIVGQQWSQVQGGGALCEVEVYHHGGVRTVRAALGKEKYEQLRAGMINGRRGTPRDVWNHWNKQNLAVSKRADEDDKSSGGSVDLAPVPEADSQ
mgnify:CR=1 FL=1